VTTINVRGYRVAGQVFSRLLYPKVDEEGPFSVEIKDLIPPVDPNKIPETAFKPPDAVAAAVVKSDPEPFYNKSSSQNDMKDYAIKGAYIEIFGPISGKRKGSLVAEMKADSSGSFKFSSIMLELDKTYRLIATWKDDNKKIAERVWITFQVRRRDVRSSAYQSAEIMDIKTKVKHEYFYNDRHPDIGPFTYTERYPKDAHFKQQTWQGAFGNSYDLQAKLAKPTVGPDILWFGGPSAILFDTFMLKVPYLHQGADAPSGADGKVIDNIDIRIGSDTWKLPVKPSHMCFVTCLTMVLNYYGLKIKIKDVMKNAAIEFMQMNRTVKNFGLSQKDFDDKILRFSPKNGTYPYCRIDILVKVADRLFSKITKAQRTNPNTPWFGKDIFATWRRGAPLDKDTYKKCLALVGAGFPIPVVERGLFDEQWYSDLGFTVPSSAADVVAHGVVITGVILYTDGAPVIILMNDPNDPRNMARLTGFVDQARYSGYMIIGRKQKQKEVNQKLLTGGGQIPPPRRERLPS
jgi:hypothetical protein